MFQGCLQRELFPNALSLRQRCQSESAALSFLFPPICVLPRHRLEPTVYPVAWLRDFGSSQAQLFRPWRCARHGEFCAEMWRGLQKMPVQLRAADSN